MAVGPRERVRARRVGGECRHAVQREGRNDGALMWVGGAAVCAGVHLFRRYGRRHDGGGVRPLSITRFFSFSSCVTAVAPAGANTGACTAATECPCLYLCGSVTSVGVGATTMATEKYRKNKKEYAAGCRGQLGACASGLQVPQTANRGVCLAGPVLRSHDCHPKSTAIDGHHRCAIEGCIHLRRKSDSIQASRRIEGVTKGGIRRFCGH